VQKRKFRFNLEARAKHCQAVRRRLIMIFFERFGTYYNGRLNEARIRGTYRATERLSFALSEQWNRFRLPIPEGNFSVMVGSFQTNYSFSRFLTLSSLIQVDTANTQAVSANIRLRWNYRPDSDMYVIFTAGTRFPSLVATATVLRKPFRLSSSHTLGDREVNMKWITRQDVKVDRVACPWLIKRFIDPQAEFLFVEEKGCATLK
jgi:hypothetical protein